MEHQIIFSREHWVVYLAEAQYYPGRLYIQLKRECFALSDLKQEEWQEFTEIVTLVEEKFKSIGATMFNWTCLLNDGYKAGKRPSILHWHMRPRFKEPVEYEGVRFTDPNFAHHYDKASECAHSTTEEELVDYARVLKKLFS